MNSFKLPCSDSDDKMDRNRSEQAYDEHLIPTALEVQQNPPCSLNGNDSTVLHKVPSDKSLELLDNKPEKITPIHAEVPEAGCLSGKAMANSAEGISSKNDLLQVSAVLRKLLLISISTSFPRSCVTLMFD